MSLRDLLAFFGAARPVPFVKMRASPEPQGVQRLPLGEPWSAYWALDISDDDYQVIRREHDSLLLGFYEQVADVRVIGSDVAEAAAEYFKYLGARIAA